MVNPKIWYWGCKNSNENKILILDSILDNFKSYDSNYSYLIDNISLLNTEIKNLCDFFDQLSNILSKKITKTQKIKKISKLKGPDQKNMFSKEIAFLIVDQMEIPYLNSEKKDLKKNLKAKAKNFRKKIKQLGGSANYTSNISDEYQRFREISKKYGDKQLLEQMENVVNLDQIPQILKTFINHEYSIPLNLNDVLLIGFSLLPTIGWIFEIFMIFRALIEKRYVYAVLMCINCYQFLFYKIISFGLLGMDFGPILKFFYLAPYASSEFNINNIKIKMDEFLNNLNLNFNRELSIK